MSATPTPQPLAGENFRRAATAHVAGRKRRNLLLLIAAYLDAGHHPSVATLTARVGVPRQVTVAWLDELEDAGLLEIRRSPGAINHYALPTPGRTA